MTTNMSPGIPRKGLLTLSLTLTLIYLYSVAMSTNSMISRQAHFDVDIPFKFRFLLPWLLSLVMPDRYLDVRWLKALVALASVYWILKLMPRLWTRLTLGAQGDAPRIQLVTWAMLAFHYCLPRELNVYYVYDLPAILLYVIVVLTLTEHDTPPWWAWVLAVVASLNRETIWIAMAHAMAFQVITRPANAERHRFLLIAMLVSAAIIGIRLLENVLLGDSFSANATPMEGEKIRFLENVQRVLHNKHHTHQFVMMGLGLIMWLPFAFKNLPGTLRWLHVASVPAIAILFWAGNITELRIYNELVPLWALSLTAFLSPAAQASTT